MGEQRTEPGPGTGRLSPLQPRLRAHQSTFLAEHPGPEHEAIHMIAAIVDHVIERCSNPRDVVFDPFAGYGTTLKRALALGREAVGIELLPNRVDELRKQIPQAHVIEGDSRELLRLLRAVQPPHPRVPVDLILTSPPYMTERDHLADPLSGYLQNDGHYVRYLRELELVAAQCARSVVPGGWVIWNVADIHHQGHTTHLIRDCAEVLGRHLSQVGISEIFWDRYPHDLVADALLVYQRPDTSRERVVDTVEN